MFAMLVPNLLQIRIKVSRKRGASLPLSRSIASAPSGIVFAADYVNLPTTLSRGAMLANASVGTTSGGDEAGHIALNTNITIGASGAPVLGSRGFVEGVVSRKTAVNRVLTGPGAPRRFSLRATYGFRKTIAPISVAPLRGRIGRPAFPHASFV